MNYDLPGAGSLWLGLFASLSAVVLYALSLGGSRTLRIAARVAFGVTALATLICFGRMMYLVTTHHFEFKYVFDHSSTTLKFPWNYSATWAGQEGSFLLWMFWTAIIGGLVAWKAGKWEGRVMPFYVTVLSFLFAITIWLHPFGMIPRDGSPNSYPADLPWPPLEGAGLHPSLQNYWMAIHPPTIFFGFASLAVPFCYAMAAMLWREYESWAERVMPWVLMTSATLGVGLFMGGYWAYETLGWHGFWAWDPVENAALFPWLAGLALLHGLIMQKHRGGMGKTNLFLAITAWLLFLYGTYLTRSGVLTEFSVHSFADMENLALLLLIVMIGTYGLAGFGLLIARWRTVPGRPISDKVLSRDTAMVSAVTLMITATVVIALLTSWPLISRWTILKSVPFLRDAYSVKGTNVLPLIYNKVGSALMIPALLFMGMVPFLAWGKTNADKFLKKLLVPWFTAILLGFGIVWFVSHEVSIGFKADTPRVLVVALGTLGIFTAAANIGLAVKLLRVKAITMGGWLAHVGIGLIILGTILSNTYEKTVTVPLVEGRSPIQTPFGYAFSFEDWTHAPLLKEAQELQQKASEASDPKEAARLNTEADARLDQMSRDWFRNEHALKVRVTPVKESAYEKVPHDSDLQKELRIARNEDLDENRSRVVETPIFKLRPKSEEDLRGDAKYMVWPHIDMGFTRDLYIFIAGDPEYVSPTVTVKPGETAPIVALGDNGQETSIGYEVKYRRFFMDGTPGQAGTMMGAELELTGPDGRTTILKPGLQLGGEAGPQPVPVGIPEYNGAAVMKPGLNAGTKEVTIDFRLPEASSRWRVWMQVTNKPFVSVVWIGVILMGMGTLIAMMRRALEARRGSLLLSNASAGTPEEDKETAPKAPAENTKPAPKPAAPIGVTAKVKGFNHR